MAVHTYRFRLDTPSVSEEQLAAEVGVSVSISDCAGGTVVDVDCDDSRAADLMDCMAARGYEFVEGDPATTSCCQFIQDIGLEQLCRLMDGDEDDDVDSLHLHVRRDRSKAYYWYEFMGGKLTANWGTTVSGTGSSVGVGGGAGGWALLTAGQDVGRYAQLQLNGTNNLYLSNNPHLCAQARVFTAELEDSQSEIGWFTSTNDYVLFTRSGVANWQAVTRRGGVSTTTDTGILADTAWHRFEIIGSSTSVIFKIDGAVVATNTTNLTTSQVYPFHAKAITTGGVVSRRLLIDWVEIVLNRAA